MEVSRTGRADRGAAATAVAVVLLALPCASFAAPPASSPPGNSAVNQYTESFPSAGGPRISNAVREHESRPPGDALGPENARRLQASGAEGRAVAALAAATAPRRSSPAGRDAALAEGGSPAAAAVAGQALGTSSSSRLGWLLPLIILATVAWSASYLWRHRSRSP